MHLKESEMLERDSNVGAEGVERCLKEHEARPPLDAFWKCAILLCALPTPIFTKLTSRFVNTVWLEPGLQDHYLTVDAVKWKNKKRDGSTENEGFSHFFFLFFLPCLHSLLPYFNPGSAWWKTPLWAGEWETLGVSLPLLIRTGQRFRSPVSSFIIISSHSFAKVNPILSFVLQRALTIRDVR